MAKQSFKDLIRKLQNRQGFAETVKFSLPGKSVLPADFPKEFLPFYHFEKSFPPHITRTKGWFRVGDLSYEDMLCERFLYFYRSGVKPDEGFAAITDDNRMQRLFDLGSMIHLYLQYNLYKVGILSAFEVRVEDPVYNISGYCDGKILFTGVDEDGVAYDEEMVLEIKSINSFQYGKLRGPLAAHIRQGSVYAHYLDTQRMCIMYYNKDTSALKIYVREKSEDYVAMTQQILKRVLFRVKVQRPPDRVVCNSDDCERAAKCPFKNTCFSL